MHINICSEEHATHTDGALPAAKSKEEIHDEIDRLAETVDMALKAYDENNDGYIYYGEFYRYVYWTLA